jgi:hypothetical protein
VSPYATNNVKINQLSPAVSSLSYSVNSNSYSLNSSSTTTAVTYEISFSGKCTNGIYTASSIPVVFTINPTSPTITQNLQISNYTCNKVTLTWNANPTATFGYAVYISKPGTATNSYSTTNNTMTLTGLAPGVNYSFWVRSRACNNVFALPSNTVSQTLPSPCPTARLAGPEVVDSNEVVVIDIPLEASQIDVFPNPNNGQFILSLFQPEYNGKATIQLYNTLGQIVYESVADFDNGILKMELKLEDIKSGNYFIKVNTDSQVQQTMIHIDGNR